MNPLSCELLYHDSVSVMLSRFTSFSKNFVICSYRVTKIFLLEVRLRQCVFCNEPLLSWSSCRCRSFGPLGSANKYCAYPIPLFSAAMELTHEKNSRVPPRVLELFRPQDFLSILLTILADHATGLSALPRCPLFFGFCWFWRQVSSCLATRTLPSCCFWTQCGHYRIMRYRCWRCMCS